MLHVAQIESDHTDKIRTSYMHVFIQSYISYHTVHTYMHTCMLPYIDTQITVTLSNPGLALKRQQSWEQVKDSAAKNVSLRVCHTKRVCVCVCA